MTEAAKTQNVGARNPPLSKIQWLLILALIVALIISFVTRPIALPFLMSLSLRRR